MSFLYKSTTGSAVNAGSFVVSVTGTSYDEKIPALDALVGSTLTCEVEKALPELKVPLVAAPVITSADQNPATKPAPKAS